MKATKLDLQNLGKLLPKSKRDIRNLFVHCTAGWPEETNDELFKGFSAQGWKSPGYHVTVDPDGTAWVLQHPDLIANGVKDYNLHSLHISYKGGIAKSGKPTNKVKLVPVDNRTPEQKATLITVLTHWRVQYPKSIIKGHRDISPDKNRNGVVDAWERIKECPCFDAIPEYASIK